MLKITKQIIALLMLLALTILPAQSKETAKWLPGSVMFERGGYRLELFAQKKEGAKAFMVGREMSAQNAQFYSQKVCSFGSAQGNVLTHKTDDSIEIDLKKWRAVPQASKGSHASKQGNSKAVGVKLMLREDWEKIWQAKGVAEDVQAAFYWSLFPTQQIYAPTDYNWGGITVPLPVGTIFDLHIWWKRGATEHTAIIKGLSCRS